MMANSYDKNDTIDSHILFMYNNISSKKSSSSEENYSEHRDDAEVVDQSFIDIPQTHNRQTSFRHPLKKMMKGLKKLVKKKCNEDNEPLMPRESFAKPTYWVTAGSKGDDRLMFKCPNTQIL